MLKHTIYSDIVDIRAPRDWVWSILVDTARYSEWNPFTHQVDTSLVVGDPVDLHVRMPIRGDRLQVETVTAVDKPERLAWGMKLGCNVLLKAERTQLLTATGPNSCRYQTWDAFSGLLTPVVTGLFGTDILNGFNGVAYALQQRAETTWNRSAA
jgi:hypothetical protein